MITRVTNAEPDVSPSTTFLRALRRRWKMFLIEFLVIYVIAIIVIFCLPTRYESEMELLVNNERQDVIVAPSDNAHSVASTQPSETQINSEMEMLRSNDILREVVLKAHLDKHEPGTVQAAGGVSPAAIEGALQALQKKVRISAVKKSNVILVSYRAKNPELAHAVLKQLLDTYLTAHVKVHGNPGSFDFFRDQAASLAGQLQQAEHRLTIFRQRYSALTMPEEKDSLMEQAIAAQGALEQTEAEIAEYQKKVEEENRAMMSLAPRVTTQIRTLPEQTLKQSLTSMLAEEQNRRTQLLTKFLPNDRMVVEVEQEIANTNALLEAAQKQSSSEQSTDLNRVRQGVETQLHSARANLTGLRARRTAQAQQVRTYQERMFELASVGVQHDALMRQVKELETNYELYEKKREESRIDQSLDQQRFTNVAVVEEPSLPVDPASPRIGLYLILGAIVAAFAAAVIEYYLPAALELEAASRPTLAAAMTGGR